MATADTFAVKITTRNGLSESDLDECQDRFEVFAKKLESEYRAKEREAGAVDEHA